MSKHTYISAYGTSIDLSGSYELTVSNIYDTLFGQMCISEFISPYKVLELDLQFISNRDVVVLETTSGRKNGCSQIVMITVMIDANTMWFYITVHVDSMSTSILF